MAEPIQTKNRFDRPLLGGPNGRRVSGPEVDFDEATRKKLLALFDEHDEARRRAWAWAHGYYVR